MSTEPWSDTVILDVPDSEDSRTVHDTLEAADCLFTYWPDGEGETYDSTMKTFARVLDGEEPADAAREAFIEAATEADLPVKG
jgi:hypothetical protein